MLVTGARNLFAREVAEETLETGATSLIRNSADDVVDETATVATSPYKRPNNATTTAQREAVQGKPCVDCGDLTSKQFANHTEPLVKEYYRTGTIDKVRMRDVKSVNSHCPTCSGKSGADLSRYSRRMKKAIRQPR